MNAFPTTVRTGNHGPCTSARNSARKCSAACRTRRSPMPSSMDVDKADGIETTPALMHPEPGMPVPLLLRSKSAGDERQPACVLLATGRKERGLEAPAGGGAGEEGLAGGGAGPACHGRDEAARRARRRGRPPRLRARPLGRPTAARPVDLRCLLRPRLARHPKARRSPPPGGGRHRPRRHRRAGRRRAG